LFLYLLFRFMILGVPLPLGKPRGRVGSPSWLGYSASLPDRPMPLRGGVGRQCAPAHPAVAPNARVLIFLRITFLGGDFSFSLQPVFYFQDE
jgi:hypothetical protein